MRTHGRGIVAGVVLAAILAGGLLAPLLLVHRTDIPFERAYGNAVVGLVTRVMAGSATNPVAGLWSIVTYLRQLQQRKASTILVPAPTADQLAFADPSSSSAAARGAAVYFAQGCAYCHGAVGNAPGELALHEAEQEPIRRGRAGMPAYGTSAISNAALQDLVAYVRTFSRSRGRD